MYSSLSLLILAILAILALIGYLNRRPPLSHALEAYAANAALPMPPTPVGRIVDVSGTDAGVSYRRGGKKLAGSVGVAMFIRYRDASGRVTQRRITIHSIDDYGGELYLRCYCHERQEPRTFKHGSILEAVDVATGEVFDSRHEILKACLEAGDTLNKQAEESEREKITLREIKYARNGLTILAFLARCDGKQDAAETGVMLDYVREFRENVEIDEDIVKLHINRLYPDRETFLEALASMPKYRLKKLAPYMVRLAEADGAVSQEESALLDELRAAIPPPKKRGRKKKAA